MLNNPLVSVIVPAYNHEAYISSTIESILGQTYKNIEIVIIDDGSSDGTLSTAQSFEATHENITVYHQSNQGISQALNIGLAKSMGKYVSLIASDDVMCSHKIEEQVNFLESHPQFSLVAGGYQKIDSSGNFIGTPIFPLDYPAEIHSDPYSGCSFLTMTALYRKSDLFKVGLFLPGIANEDWYIQIMLKKAGFRFYSLPSCCCLYRIHGSNTHADILKSIRSKKQLANLFDEHDRLQIIVRSYVHAFGLSKRYKSLLFQIYWGLRLILAKIFYYSALFALRIDFVRFRKRR